MSDKLLKNMMSSCNKEDLNKFKEDFDKALSQRIREEVKENLFEHEELEEGLFDTLGKAAGAASNVVGAVKKVVSFPSKIKNSFKQQFQAGMDAQKFSKILKKYRLNNMSRWIYTAYPSLVAFMSSNYSYYGDFLNDKYPKVAQTLPNFLDTAKKEMEAMAKMIQTGKTLDGKYKLTNEEIVMMGDIFPAIAQIVKRQVASKSMGSTPAQQKDAVTAARQAVTNAIKNA